MKYKKLCLAALFAAFLSIVAPLTIPLGATALSLATFAVYITSFCLGKTAVFSVLTYLILGAIGLPVFAGFRGGADVLFGPGGGYLWGYVLCALIVGFSQNRFFNRKFLLLISLIIGTVAIYFSGILQFMFLTKTDFGAAFLVCVLPFIPFDTIKILAAVLLSSKIKSALRL